MSTPTIAVIIPTFNRGELVTSAVESALNQRFSNYEIIVVDDGSTDNTRDVLSRFAGAIRYIYQQNRGVSAARNIGIRAANSEWVAFLDSDDEWDANYLATQIDAVNGDARLSMQTTNCSFIGREGVRDNYFAFNGSAAAFGNHARIVIRHPFRFIVEHGPWQVGSTIIRRDAIYRAGLFDERFRLSEDIHLMARVAMHGDFAMLRPELVRVFRRDEQTKSLTEQAKDDPILARQMNDLMYHDLEKLKGLRKRDRQSLRRVMSANQRAIGNLLDAKGNVRSAREYYRRACFTWPSAASIGRYALFTMSTAGKNEPRLV